MDTAVGRDVWNDGSAAAAALESPFEEAGFASVQELARVDPLTFALTPFADREDQSSLAEVEGLLRETIAELHDEEFHEAVSSLVEETEAAVDERFEGEDTASPRERERFARSFLAPVQFEADQYLASLEAGLSEADPTQLSPDALEEVLERYDPRPGDLSPASEEFIGKLAKKAKGVVRKVAKAAAQIGKLAAPLLAPMLKKLRGLVRPLLERVLRFAIGKLPQPLQPKARILADRLLGKVGQAAPTSAAGPSSPVAPAQATDTEELADSFDLSLAEALAFPTSFEPEADLFGGDPLGERQDESVPESEELAALAEARADLIDRLSASEGADSLAPQIEQFVPVLLMALKTGIGLVGRPKVVGFLANYLTKMIEQYVGKQGSLPLSKAIVDAGLRMVSLEAEEGNEAHSNDVPDAEAGAVALASVVEDTVRRLAEAENYLFEDQGLTEVAIAEAFGEAAATYLPQETIREELQLAPSLGGRFVTRRPRKARSFAKYSRAPEVAISARAADALPAFSGGSLGAAVRAAGGRFPLRARMHIFQARPGATVASMVRHGVRSAPKTIGAFPLTRRAAGVLLGEPGIGTQVPGKFLQTKRRISAAQRLYVLEPLDQTTAMQTSRKMVPGRAWVAISPARSRITLGFYFSESDAQLLAGALRTGKGHGEVLRKILQATRSLSQSGDNATGGLAREDGEELEAFVSRAGGALPAGFVADLRSHIAAWALPALSKWLPSHTDAFLAAAAHPDPGIRLKIRLSDVPGLAKVAAGGVGASLSALGAAMRGKPQISISVMPGHHRK